MYIYMYIYKRFKYIRIYTHVYYIYAYIYKCVFVYTMFECIYEYIGVPGHPSSRRPGQQHVPGDSGVV